MLAFWLLFCVEGSGCQGRTTIVCTRQEGISKKLKLLIRRIWCLIYCSLYRVITPVEVWDSELASSSGTGTWRGLESENLLKPAHQNRMPDYAKIGHP
jgi:hypothetical protein